MKIWCTVVRKNGTYKTIAVKAGKKDFTLDKNVYNVTKYHIGKIGPIHVLRAIYWEGYSLPIDIEIDKELKKVNLKIDSKGVKNLTNKKILDVFGEAEFTRMEIIMMMICVGALIIGVVNLFFLWELSNKIVELTELVTSIGPSIGV